MARIPLIHNPAAGGGRGQIRYREAEALLGLRDIQVEAVSTQRPGHATELAASLAAAGHETLLVMGGDGTLSEAANGILRLPANERPRLGFIPAGTGNDFLRDFGVFDLESAVRAIQSGRTTAVDAVQVAYGDQAAPATGRRPLDDGPRAGPSGGSRFVINVSGTGLMAKAADRCNRQFKWAGRKGYDMAAVVELARMRATPTRLVLDGREVPGNYPLVAVCNSVHTGGGMKMAPGAKPTDGLLDVLVVEDAGALELMGLLATKLRKGLHVNHPKVRIERAARIRIEPRPDSPLMLDGEVMGSTPAEFQVLPGALRLLA